MGSARQASPRNTRLLLTSTSQHVPNSSDPLPACEDSFRLLCLLPYHQGLEQCLAHSRLSGQICRINRWIYRSKRGRGCRRSSPGWSQPAACIRSPPLTSTTWTQGAREAAGLAGPQAHSRQQRAEELTNCPEAHREQMGRLSGHPRSEERGGQASHRSAPRLSVPHPRGPQAPPPNGPARQPPAWKHGITHSVSCQSQDTAGREPLEHHQTSRVCSAREGQTLRIPFSG